METNVRKQTDTIDGRLGKCEVCNFNLAKYTCPKCEVRTCRLECLNIHKKELKCDGIRDKTKYIPLKQITESDLMSDYVFLESCTNYASARRTDKIKRYTTHDRSLTVPQSKLKRAAAAPQRQITLEFLLPNFNKHKNNTTFYDWKSKVIYWRIEWHFISKNKNQIAIDERCNESESMTTLITKYFKCKNTIDEIREKDIEDVVLLLKAEGIRKCKNRYYPMEISRTLQENLNKRTIIEFPVIYVVLKEDVKDFDVINDDEELIEEETRKHKNIYLSTANDQQREAGKKRRLGTDSDVKTQNTEEPVNFLFSNEMDDGSSEE